MLSLLGFMGACSNKPYVVENSELDVADATTIYIANHGWHTGFIIPAADIQAQLPELQRRFADAPFLEFGWGDKGFYQAKEITSGLTLRAILWSTESVVHAVAVSQRPDIYFAGSDVKTLCLNKKQYSGLIRFIENSFYKNEKNMIVTQKEGIYGDSQFYTGEGDYYMMNTCNKWTAKGLKSAGLDIWPAFKLTATSIMDYLEAASVTGACDTPEVSAN